MTGTVFDSSRMPLKFESVPSTTKDGTFSASAGAPGAAGADWPVFGGRTNDDRSTAPRRLDAEMSDTRAPLRQQAPRQNQAAGSSRRWQPGAHRTTVGKRRSQRRP